jgi:hypothetical protein
MPVEKYSTVPEDISEGHSQAIPFFRQACVFLSVEVPALGLQGAAGIVQHSSPIFVSCRHISTHQLRWPFRHREPSGLYRRSPLSLFRRLRWPSFTTILWAFPFISKRTAARVSANSIGLSSTQT